MDSHDLMNGLALVDHVIGVELHWSPGLEVRVRLDAMDWDARAAAIAVIDDFAREHVDRVTVTARFDFPEPLDFTLYEPTPGLAARSTGRSGRTPAG